MMPLYEKKPINLAKLAAGCLLFTLLMITMKMIGWVIVLSIVPCLYLMFQVHSRIKMTQKLHGTVVSYSESRGSKKTYALNVAYQDQSGETRTLTGSVSSSHPPKKIGDAVIVLQSKDGSEIKIFLFDELFLWYWIWLCIGITVGGFLFGQNVLEWYYL